MTQPWRRYILRALLGSLAFAAVAGVAAVLMASNIGWRIAGTGIATAVAALLMMPMSVLVDKPRWQGTGLAGMTTLLALFFLSLGMIWRIHRVLPGTWDEQQLLITMGSVLGAGTATAVFLRMLQAPLTRVAGWTGLVLAGVFFVTSLAGTWLPRFGATTASYFQLRDQLWATASTIGLLGILIVIALVGMNQDRRYWRWLGVVASGMLTALYLLEIWRGAWLNEEVGVPLLAVGGFVAFANLVVRTPLTDQQRWLGWGALASGLATALLGCLVAWGFEGALTERLTGAAAVLTACAALALIVLSRLNRRSVVEVDTLPPEISNVTLFCPACNRKQTMALGKGACSTCGLHIEVNAVVPRCVKCGYLLYQLRSNTCPECGTTIAAVTDG